MTLAATDELPEDELLTLASEPLDRGAREALEPPCAKRIGWAWCILGPGHAGECEVPPERPLPVSDFGPIAATRRRRA